mmetsp:Transcript_3055/g.7074  ORF Transcript_3055/g.7074 Transcript_3055/m.7074 type:complete len:468 (-) Transcript_3055:3031-4434(-)
MARGRLFCLIASLASSVAIVDVNGLGSTADTPHVGRTSTKSANGSRANVFVIGTSHFRCGSAVEVASLIAEVRPDGLLLELDPERTVRLTKQFHRFNADGEKIPEREQQRGPESNVNGDLLYGADFVSAINTCQDLDIPLFLGDEYAQETFSRLREKSLDWKSYSPVPLLRSFMTNMSRGVSSSDFIDIVQTFRSDPQKATPLLVTTSPSVVLASGLLALSAHSGASAHDGVSSLADMGETLLSVTFSALLSSLLFNTIIRDRDEVLAQSALNSIDVLSSLKQGQSVRKRWRFSVNDDRGDGDKTLTSSQIPIFTLKRPLLKGIERNLNLFEPRWLKMIDSLSSEAEARFGCVQCVNKFYSTIAVGDKEGRYADIIFKRKGRIARIKRIEEGKRPSGDRRIGVTIEGCESFVVDNENISVVEDGYMVSHANSLSEKSPKPSETDRVTLVVVVGLLHGNGILDILNKS